MEDTQNRIDMLADMIRCCHNLWFWRFDPNTGAVSGDCPDALIARNLFDLDHHGQTLIEYAEIHKKPTVLSNTFGLLWIAVPEKENELLIQIHVVGPFFAGGMDNRALEQALAPIDMTPSMRYETLRFLRSLPVISLSRFFEYAIMLYFCVTGERISVSDIHYRQNTFKMEGPGAMQSSAQRIHGTYEAEQEMLRLVREGDLNYKNHMNKMSMTGNMGDLSNGDPLRQMKNAVLVCITLFSRAAIEGGLAPEISFTLTDHYFQSVEACTSINELAEISHTMQGDFIERVHRCRTSELSKPIQACRDYVELHLEDVLSTTELAKQLGYSDYYLSKKFKAEMGVTLKEFIRRKRIERAKFLLKNTQESVSEISERLQFCSQSYFGDVFKKIAGMSPSEYREAAD